MLMYPVVRFASIQMSSDLCNRLGSELNSLRPVSYVGPRPKGDGFAVELSKTHSWDLQRSAILEFIRVASPVISNAQEQAINVSVDIAIEQHDVASQNVLVSIRLDPEFSRTLGAADVGLEFSVYRTED